ncbi:hypothetical protein FIA58_008785 [Flavobacterium jejuense]|uniref:Uncharacterized protein n=1 Tax=Flavobacterium jejuense TaxID=1544455 RepID=A0ABX0ITB9_9FLAO|nr:hypothetical protein [Flavobacterium jejuense]NHN25768.1 hypothetical protein [Flavobacterium jejuense]
MEKIKNDINTGQQIFDNVPNIIQPDWAGLVLSRFDQFLEKVPDEIIELYEIIDDSERWRDAHKQFSKIRNLTLKNNNPQFEIYLLLAECIAKITYNSSGLPAPFDSDSGFYIPSLALKFSDTLSNKYLNEEVKATILIFNKNKEVNNKLAKDLIIHKKIDDILWNDWDPIGINGSSPRDEYSVYVAGLFKLKKENADRMKIGKRLLELETNSMGMNGNLDNCLIVADKILNVLKLEFKTLYN